MSWEAVEFDSLKKKIIAIIHEYLTLIINKGTDDKIRKLLKKTQKKAIAKKFYLVHA